MKKKQNIKIGDLIQPGNLIEINYKSESDAPNCINNLFLILKKKRTSYLKYPNICYDKGYHLCLRGLYIPHTEFYRYSKNPNSLIEDEEMIKYFIETEYWIIHQSIKNKTKV